MNSVPATEANALRCGYDLGFFDVDCIVRWADNLIDRLTQPPIQLIDLAMSRKATSENIVALLEELGTKDDSSTLKAALGFIGLLHRLGEMTTAAVVRRLYSFANQTGVSPDERAEMYYLDDALDLATAGTWGSIEDVRQAVDAFLAPYAQRLALDFPHLLSLRQSRSA